MVFTHEQLVQLEEKYKNEIEVANKEFERQIEVIEKEHERRVTMLNVKLSVIDDMKAIAGTETEEVEETVEEMPTENTTIFPNVGF